MACSPPAGFNMAIMSGLCMQLSLLGAPPLQSTLCCPPLHCALYNVHPPLQCTVSFFALCTVFNTFALIAFAMCTVPLQWNVICALCNVHMCCPPSQCTVHCIQYPPSQCTLSTFAAQCLQSALYIVHAPWSVCKVLPRNRLTDKSIVPPIQILMQPNHSSWKTRSLGVSGVGFPNPQMPLVANPVNPTGKQAHRLESGSQSHSQTSQTSPVVPLLAHPVKTSLQARARVWLVSPTCLLLEVRCPCTSVSQSAFLEGTIKLFLLGLHSHLVNGPSEVAHNNVQCACLQFHICNVTMYNVTLS